MATLEIKRENGKIFCPLTNSWHIETPEERVRQGYIKTLVEEYGYSLDQMAQEIRVTNSQRGQGNARADIVVWKSKEDKDAKRSAYDFNHHIDRFVKDISNDYKNKILRLIKRRNDLQEKLKQKYYSDICLSE